MRRYYEVCEVVCRLPCPSCCWSDGSPHGSLFCDGDLHHAHAHGHAPLRPALRPVEALQNLRRVTLLKKIMIIRANMFH